MLGIDMLSQMFKNESIAKFFLTRSTHQDCYNGYYSYHPYEKTTKSYTLLFIINTTLYYKYYCAL